MPGPYEKLSSFGLGCDLELIGGYQLVIPTTSHQIAWVHGDSIDVVINQCLRKIERTVVVCVLSRQAAYGNTSWDTTQQGRLFHSVVRCLFCLHRAAWSNVNEAQINERAALMVKLVDKLLRGRAQPSARHEAAAAVSDVRSFVRAWRPTSGTASAATATKTAADSSMSEEDIALGEERRGYGDLVRPSADVLLKLAQVKFNILTLADTNQGIRLRGAKMRVGAVLHTCLLRANRWIHGRYPKTSVIIASRREGSESDLDCPA